MLVLTRDASGDVGIFFCYRPPPAAPGAPATLPASQSGAGVRVAAAGVAVGARAAGAAGGVAGAAGGEETIGLGPVEIDAFVVDVRQSTPKPTTCVCMRMQRRDARTQPDVPTP